MTKVYILDTNVLVHDPDSIFKFEDNDIVLPLVVIEELDRLKNDPMLVGQNARRVIRHLEKLREDGNLDEGVTLENGGTLTVELADEEMMKSIPHDFSDSPDNRILAIALKYFDNSHSEPCREDADGNCIDCDDCVFDAERDVEHDVIIVTKDTNLRIKANAIGIPAQDYRNDKVSFDELYTGTAEIYVPKKVIDNMYKEDECLYAGTEHAYMPNQCITLVDDEDFSGKHTVLTRYDSSLNILCRISDITKDNAPSGLIPRNREQRFAMDLLLDPNIKLVTLVGKAGCGKTLMAIAAGLHMVLETGEFDRLLVTRPVISLGKQDIGFLPGTLEEKMQPWMQPIYDNLDVLLGKADNKKNHKGSFDKEEAVMTPADYLKKAGKLEVGALSYIRGRSIPKQFIIVDEAQNLTPHEVKTIITRAGEGTKIILTGDPYQIDNPYLNISSNGLVYCAEKFKDHKIAGHITLVKGERSELAEIAAERL